MYCMCNPYAFLGSYDPCMQRPMDDVSHPDVYKIAYVDNRKGAL
jgi:hypothetical protein